MSDTVTSGTSDVTLLWSIARPVVYYLYALVIFTLSFFLWLVAFGWGVFTSMWSVRFIPLLLIGSWAAIVSFQTGQETALSLSVTVLNAVEDAWNSGVRLVFNDILWCSNDVCCLYNFLTDIGVALVNIILEPLFDAILGKRTIYIITHWEKFRDSPCSLPGPSDCIDCEDQLFEPCWDPAFSVTITICSIISQIIEIFLCIIQIIAEFIFNLETVQTIEDFFLTILEFIFNQVGIPDEAITCLQDIPACVNSIIVGQLCPSQPSLSLGDCITTFVEDQLVVAMGCSSGTDYTSCLAAFIVNIVGPITTTTFGREGHGTFTQPHEEGGYGSKNGINHDENAKNGNVNNNNNNNLNPQTNLDGIVKTMKQLNITRARTVRNEKNNNPTLLAEKEIMGHSTNIVPSLDNVMSIYKKLISKNTKPSYFRLFINSFRAGYIETDKIDYRTQSPLSGYRFSRDGSILYNTDEIFPNIAYIAKTIGNLFGMIRWGDESYKIDFPSTEEIRSIIMSDDMRKSSKVIGDWFGSEFRRIRNNRNPPKWMAKIETSLTLLPVRLLSPTLLNDTLDKLYKKNQTLYGPYVKEFFNDIGDGIIEGSQFRYSELINGTLSRRYGNMTNNTSIPTITTSTSSTPLHAVNSGTQEGSDLNLNGGVHLWDIMHMFKEFDKRRSESVNNLGQRKSEVSSGDYKLSDEEFKYIAKTWKQNYPDEYLRNPSKVNLISVWYNATSNKATLSENPDVILNTFRAHERGLPAGSLILPFIKNPKVILASLIPILTSPPGQAVVNIYASFFANMLSGFYSTGIQAYTPSEIAQLGQDFLDTTLNVLVYLTNVFINYALCFGFTFLFRGLSALFLLIPGIGIMITFILNVALNGFALMAAYCPPLPITDESGNPTQNPLEYLQSLMLCFTADSCSTDDDCPGKAPCRCQSDAQYNSYFWNIGGSQTCPGSTGICLCWPKIPCGSVFPEIELSTPFEVDCVEEFGYKIDNVVWYQTSNVWTIFVDCVNNLLITAKFLTRWLFNGIMLPDLIVWSLFLIPTFIIIFGNLPLGLVILAVLVGYLYLLPLLVNLLIDPVVPYMDDHTGQKYVGWVYRIVLEFVRFPNYTDDDPLGSPSNGEEVCTLVNVPTAFLGAGTLWTGYIIGSTMVSSGLFFGVLLFLFVTLCCPFRFLWAVFVCMNFYNNDNDRFQAYMSDTAQFRTYPEYNVAQSKNKFNSYWKRISNIGSKYTRQMLGWNRHDKVNESMKYRKSMLKLLSQPHESHSEVTYYDTGSSSGTSNGRKDKGKDKIEDNDTYTALRKRTNKTNNKKNKNLDIK